MASDVLPDAGSEASAMQAQVAVGTGKRVAAWTYGYWAVVGALVSVGIAALATVGIALLALAITLAVVGVLVPALRGQPSLGLVGGLAVAPLWIAWLNRDGPGDVCTTTATTQSCAEQWSPWPFAVVGVALVVACVLLIRRARNRDVLR